MNYLNFTDPADMHRAVDKNVRVNHDAQYIADFTVDTIEMVNRHVPSKNHDAVRDNPWLRKVAEAFGTVPLEGLDPRDPVIIYERDGLVEPINYDLTDALPHSPRIHFCASCSEWDTVHPVHLPSGPRVVEILACKSCVDALGVEAS